MNWLHAYYLGFILGVVCATAAIVFIAALRKP